MRKTILGTMLLILVVLPLNLSAAPFETVFNDFFFLGDFHTYDYASHVDLENTWIGTSSFLDNSFSWQHTLPGDLNPAGVDRARLWIDAAYVGSDGNAIDINGFMDWDPLNHTWLDNSTYDLTSLSSVDQLDFWSDGHVDVSVFAGEGSLRLDNSLLLMDYSPTATTNSDIYSSVPEPASIALLGLGLLGLGIVRRKK